MSQTRIHFAAEKTVAERLYALMEVAFEDDGFPIAIFATDEEERIHEVSIYVDDNVEATEERMRALAAEADERVDLEREVLGDVDWVARSLEGLKPVRAGRFLVHGSHDRARRRTPDIGIEIEAGLAFGTGHHGTTSGCLDMIDRVVTREKPRNALDLGTGSAVLAIGLAKLARIPVLATDIDAVAVAVARENAHINGVGHLVETATATGFHHPVFAAGRPFDLIVANILAGPLMKLAPDMARHIAPNGSLVLSGILERQRNAVLAAYVGQSFRHVRTLPREGWVTLWLKR
ncbi:50S ribosomal protein L11 methyltransferase [Chelativorans sp. ZYF759]|uniref:50S ribosomal protein L11 methyltransferase n=1 Tax=Chelativorans sp. ZYF759 TaxID=2692213 RepID=UPI00145F6D33|nr:50S ribosomal protein L11 methyltransferase [Chelativorans sp. ZYF759]NMG41511.1 50S ribosomal protein L11 methyltransferase [Chelativorans sp. ZYF759]